MEARQRVKLSLTNRSIGLISLRTRPAQQQARKKTTTTPRPHISIRQTHRIKSSNILKDTYGVSRRSLRAVGRPGGHSEGPAPDPIPNSAVKTLRANGTAS